MNSRSASPPPASSDAETVNAFINEACGWTVTSWDAGLVTICYPVCR